MPPTANGKDTAPHDATRKVARVVFSTIKQFGSIRGETLKNIQDYIKEEYPNSPSNIVKLNNTLEKALAFGAITKKTENSNLLEGPGPSKGSSSITQGRRRRRKSRKGRRRRSRSRRRRSRRRSISTRKTSDKPK